MTTQVLYPDALVTQTGLTGAVTAIDDDADTSASDTDYLSSNGTTVCTLIASFPTPSGNPTTGTGIQNFRFRARTVGRSAPPKTLNWALYDDSNTSLQSGTVSITSTSFLTYTVAWDAANLTVADGSSVRMYLYGGYDSSPPTSQWSWEISALEWNVDYTAAGTSVAITGVTATAANWSPSLSREVPVSGASSSAESGLSPAFRAAALLGVSALSGDGSIGYALAPALVGQDAAGASGTPGVDRFADLFGYEAVSAAGVLSTVSGVGVELTGVLAQSAQWSMTPDRQAPILSALGQSAVGLLIPSRSVPVSGQSAAVASGALSAWRLAALLGASGISGDGVPTPGRSASPTGEQALTALGDLWPTVGDDSHPRFCCVGT